MTIDYFKKRAKKLLDAAQANDGEALERVRAVLHDPSGVTLMRAQHVVAVEAGFGQWTDLINASDVELRLVITMDKEPSLADFGMSVRYEAEGLTPSECRTRIAEDRKALRHHVHEVEWTVAWLRENVAPITTINQRRTSYGLKHLAEKHYEPSGYLTNGVFIAAAIVAGYSYKTFPDSPNVMFGMSEASLKRIEQGKSPVHPVGATTRPPMPAGVKNPRRTAWRNMMVAAINHALGMGLFSLEPNDRWSHQGHGPGTGEVYRFTFNNSIEAIAYINDAGYDELVFHVALWPTADSERWIRCSNGGLLTGECWASGWFERRRGAWLQNNGKGRPSFGCRRDRLPLVAAAKIEAKGYKDSGPVLV